MDTTHIYTTKAEKYARYRWDYPKQAVAAILESARIDPQSCVADLGAGTGIFTRHFFDPEQANLPGQVYAVEPNLEMARLAHAALRRYPGCAVIAGRAEAIPLPAASLDLVTVAQAIHWFDPVPARAEILRVLKPGGWLALIRNYNVDQAQNAAFAAICTPENGVRPGSQEYRPEQKPASFYYGAASCDCAASPQRLTFRFTGQQDWGAFIGSLLSASYMPDETDPLYPRLESAARRIFDQFSSGGLLTTHGEAEVWLGVPGL